MMSVWFKTTNKEHGGFVHTSTFQEQTKGWVRPDGKSVDL